jgi:hypothetical protein
MDADLKRWQARMAPFMVAAIVATALFFAIATIWKFGNIEARLMKPSSESGSAAAWSTTIAPRDFNEQMRLEATRAAYGLERELVARRYEQANLSYLNRLWTRFMGFVTGMVLAFVGAGFVLGKLETDKGEFEAAASGMSMTMRSTSPGLLLAALGTCLMGLSIAVPVHVSFTDAAVYFVPPRVSYYESPSMTSVAPSSRDEPPLKQSRSASAGEK